MSIYHIAEPDRWDPDLAEYAAAGLTSEGFIHCSTADQLPRVAKEFYAGRSDLVLLTINTEGVVEDLVWEDLYDLNEDFPHIYGPIPMNAITMAEPFSPPNKSHLQRGRASLRARGEASQAILGHDASQARDTSEAWPED